MISITSSNFRSESGLSEFLRISLKIWYMIFVIIEVDSSINVCLDSFTRSILMSQVTSPLSTNAVTARLFDRKPFLLLKSSIFNSVVHRTYITEYSVLGIFFSRYIH